MASYRSRGRGGGRIPSRARGVVVIEGDLKDLALSSLLQATHVDRSSGILRLEGGGELHIIDGEIVAAFTPKESGYAAVMSLLCRRHGRFSFTSGEPPPAAPLAPIMNLLLESARLDDEWQRVASLVVRLVDRRRLPPGDACIAALAEWIDGRRTVAELAHFGVASTTEVIASIRSALECGAIARVRTDNRAHTQDVEVDRDFDELIDGARSKIRADDLEGAARLLHRALGRRPEDRIARQNLRRVSALLTSRRQNLATKTKRVKKT